MWGSGNRDLETWFGQAEMTGLSGAPYGTTAHEVISGNNGSSDRGYRQMQRLSSARSCYGSPRLAPAIFYCVNADERHSSGSPEAISPAHLDVT